MNQPGRGRIGLALVGTSFALVWLTALLGPSVASQGGLGVKPSPWLVTGLLAVAVLAGAAGIATAWSAVRRGWSPSPRRLLAGGLVAMVAFVFVPPVTSDDVYSYAAYGRLAVLGRDPYTTAPDQLHDPVGDAVGDPWRGSPSIYGPLATAEQALVMRIAGTSVRLATWLLSLISAAAMAIAALVLDRLAGANDAARRRAALLFALNPLVVVPVVAGAHVDALLVLGIVGAVALVRRHAFAAGVVVGAAFCVKLTGALAGAGLLWWLRRTPRRAIAFAAATVLVAVPAYLAVGGVRATEQARRASRFVSFAVPWRVLTPHLSRPLIGLLALVAIAALVLLLHHGLPDSDGPERAALVVVLAWVLGATYLLPWYDAWAWCLLALLAWSRWDELLLAHTTVLMLAYLPGRTVPMPTGLAHITMWTRKTAAPVLLGAAACYAIRLATGRASRTRR